MNREEALSIVWDCLKPGRFRHSVGVAETAEKLALLWGADPEKAFLAGILHDYAKDMEEERLIASVSVVEIVCLGSTQIGRASCRERV